MYRGGENLYIINQNIIFYVNRKVKKNMTQNKKKYIVIMIINE